MKNGTALKLFAILTAVLMLLTGCTSAQTGSQGESSQPDEGGQPVQSTDISSIEMPTVDLSNNSKVLKVFGWSSMDENETDGEAAVYFKEEFGVKIEETVSTHSTYWSDLGKMVAADTAPDVVDLTYSHYFPTPITENLIVPWDGIIDFDTALWADSKEIIESNKWGGKVYYPVISEFMTSWLYYNKNMFRNYGVETPRDLYEKGEWTFDKMLELSDMFIEKNTKNEIVQWGFVPQNIEYITISGKPLVELSADSYVNNLKDANIAKVMNGLSSISRAGTGSMSTSDACPLFEREEVAMLMSSATLTLETRFEGLRNSEALGFAPLPKLDDEIGHCVEVAIDPGYGLIKGAKNTELAALWVNYLKWFRLGENFCVQIPVEENTPAKQRYNIKAKAGSAKLSDEDIKFIEDYLETDPTKVYNEYRSTVRNMDDLQSYRSNIISGGAQWSAFVQQMYPIYETGLKDYIK